MSQADVAVKQGAYKFLSKLHQELNARLLDAPLMRESIQKLLVDLNQKSKEAMFVSYHALPVIYGEMQIISNIGEKEARQALLCEFWNTTAKKYCEQTAS